MARAAVLAIKVVADATQAQGELDKTAGTVSKTGKTLGKLAAPAAIALGAVAVFGKTAVQAASEVEQSMGGLEAVFGKNSDQAKDLAKNSAKATGLATADYATMAAQIGSQLKGMGTAQKDLVPSTDKLIALGADLAATYGGTTADAVSAVSSLLRGERDPIERYGVSLNQATVNAKLAAMGLSGLTGAAQTQAQAQATMALLTEKTTAAQGQFAAQTNTTAEQQQIANAEMKNAQAALGKGLLPVVTAVTKALGGLASWVAKNTVVVGILVGVVAALAAGVIVVNFAIKAFAAAQQVWIGVTKAAAAAQKVWNLAMAANPIGLVVAAIALFVVGLVVAYKKVGWFRAFVDTSFAAILKVVKAVSAWVQNTFGGLFSAGFDAAAAAARGLVSSISLAMGTVTSIFRGVKGIIEAIADAIRTVIGLIGRIKIPKIPHIPGTPFAVPPPAGSVTSANARATAGLGRTATARATAGGGARPIIVQGALDPVAVARQIAALLGREGLRTGTVPGLTPGWAVTARGATP